MHAPGQRCTGVILAGGRASRFAGEAKGLLTVGGVRIVDRVCAALAAAADGLLLVANDPTAARWLPDVETIADERPGLGPLGGLLTAMRHARSAVLVVAWDMPFVPPALLRELRSAGERAGTAVVPASDESPSGVEPLCAYLPSAWLPEVERAVDAGTRRMDGVVGGARVLRVTRTELARFGDPALMFANVNTPDELRAARDTAGGT